MINKVRTYNAHWDLTILPLGVLQTQFQIPDNGRRMYLKKIIWDMNVTANAIEVVPINNNTVLLQHLTINPWGGNIILNPIQNAAGSVVTTAATMQLYTPGIYYFDDLITSNNIPMVYRIDNLDPLRNLNVLVDIIIEIQTEN